MKLYVRHVFSWIISTVMGCGLLIPSSSSAYLKSHDPNEERGIDLATLTLVLISTLCFVTLGIVVVRLLKLLKRETDELRSVTSQF